MIREKDRERHGDATEIETDKKTLTWSRRVRQKKKQCHSKTKK